MQFDFSDKIVVVTGAASGIGRAAAERFYQLGANVCALDVDEEGLTRLQSSTGFRLQTLCADVSKPEQWQPTLDKLHRIDLLCNIAAIIDPGEPDIDHVMTQVSSRPGLAQLTSDLQRVFAVNYLGPYLLSIRAAQKMKGGGATLIGSRQRRGVIINLGSTNVFTLHSKRLAYAPLKAALHTLTLLLAKELASYGIRVNCVVPGATEGTAIIRDVESAQKRIPLGINEVDDVVDAIVFLGSEYARNVTGVLLTVDGGRCVAAW